MTTMAIWLGGCSGSIVTDSGGDAPSTGDRKSPGGPSSDPDPSVIPPGSIAGGSDNALIDSAGPRPLRRLTSEEFHNTVRDLLGEPSTFATTYPEDGPGGTGFLEAGTVSEVSASRLVSAAGTVAARLMAKLSTFAPCDAKTGEEACALSFIKAFTRKAFRRPAAPTEIDALMALYKRARGALGFDHATSVGAMVQQVLQSPKFLYLWESTGKPQLEGALAKLGPHELASRLSYFLWKTMPDEALRAAADADGLGTPEAVDAQLDRMLKDVKARDGIKSFFTDWLELPDVFNREKDVKTFPLFSRALQNEMIAETVAFAQYVTLDDDGKLATLLTAPYTFVTPTIAKVYGVAMPAGNGLQKVSLDPRQRAGLLTQPSRMALGSDVIVTSPVRRGKPIRDRLLCDELSPPPSDVPPPPHDPNLPSREQFAQLTSNPQCAGCHKFMDPLGWAFEHLNAIGQYRDADAGKPVDSTGSFVSMKGGGTKSFDGVAGLAQILAGSDEVRECFARNMARFGLGRLEDGKDGGSLKSSFDAFKRSDFGVRELVKALARSKAFRYRATLEGEVL